MPTLFLTSPFPPAHMAEFIKIKCTHDVTLTIFFTAQLYFLWYWCIPRGLSQLLTSLSSLFFSPWHLSLMDLPHLFFLLYFHSWLLLLSYYVPIRILTVLPIIPHFLVHPQNQIFLYLLVFQPIHFSHHCHLSLSCPLFLPRFPTPCVKITLFHNNHFLTLLYSLIALNHSMTL